MSERVEVLVRVRPFLSTDKEDAELTTLVLDEKHVCCGDRRVFRVDHAFMMEADTAELYRTSVEPVLQDFLAGFNATVMAYGQTGTGKTFTVTGLLPLLIDKIVDDGFAGSTSELSFEYVEVYGDTLRDLLAENPTESAKSLQLYDAVAPAAAARRASSAGVSGPADARERNVGGCFIAGALRVTAADKREVLDILEYGAMKRATAVTHVHQHSSRSHSVFIVFNHRTGSKLSVVDLAGSERNKKTHSVGQRFQESIAINEGLLALGNVIRALSRRHTQGVRTGHVPFRSSKLTRLLQDSLGGDGKTVFIACVAPDSYNADETLRTLQYCALASHVLNAPVKQSPTQQRRRRRHGHDSPSRYGNEETLSDGVANQSPSTENLVDSAIAEELSMYKQLCAEQEEEVAALHQRIAERDARLRLCEEELGKDKALFNQQIETIQRLIEDNRALRTRGVARGAGVNAGRQSSVRPSDSARAPTDPRCRRPSSSHMLAAHTDPQRDWEGVAQGSAPLVQKTVAFSELSDQAFTEDEDSEWETHAQRLPMTSDRMRAERPSSRARLSSQRVRRAGRLPPQPLAVSDDTSEDEQESHESGLLPENQARPQTSRDTTRPLYHESTASGSGEDASERDDQLLLLTREALRYQRANADLKHELTTKLAALEAEQRDAAMMRVELQEIRELLDSKSP